MACSIHLHVFNQANQVLKISDKILSRWLETAQTNVQHFCLSSAHKFEQKPTKLLLDENFLSNTIDLLMSICQSQILSADSLNGSLSFLRGSGCCASDTHLSLPAQKWCRSSNQRRSSAVNSAMMPRWSNVDIIHQLPTCLSLTRHVIFFLPGSFSWKDEKK